MSQSHTPIGAPHRPSHPDDKVYADRVGVPWSDLSQHREKPEIDFDRMDRYRKGRLKQALKRHDCAFVMLTSPISLRYGVEYRNYALFQSHIPTAYAFLPMEGPILLHAAYGREHTADQLKPGQPISYFDGGEDLERYANALADDILAYLVELGTDNRRVALEYINPSITLACQRRGLEAIDGVLITEAARMIKSPDELGCMRWAIAVAEHGIAQVQQVIQPGVSELQLWALLNYCNLANDGNWHDGRMLASGDRINPWLQEASARRLEAGDLVGFDTDMVGPFGYFADISRTMFCGPGAPSARQKQLYRLAHAEVTHNMAIVKAGLSFEEFRTKAFIQDEKYWPQAYTCLAHAVGMCDEAPQVKHIFRGPQPYAGTFEAGMVICIESYMGAVGERDGVKLEQQVLVTEDGCEAMSTYPWDERLLSTLHHHYLPSTSAFGATKLGKRHGPNWQPFKREAQKPRSSRHRRRFFPSQRSRRQQQR